MKYVTDDGREFDAELEARDTGVFGHGMGSLKRGGVDSDEETSGWGAHAREPRPLEVDDQDGAIAPSSSVISMEK